MVSIETYTLGIILLSAMIVLNLFLAMLTGGKRKNILKTDFWIIFGLSMILIITIFILITSNVVDLSTISNNSLFKSIFSLG